MGAFPDGKSTGQQLAAFICEDENATAAIRCVMRNLYEASPLQRLQSSGQSGSIHRQQGSDRTHGGRFRPIKRHQQRELSIGKVKRSQLFIKASGQSARSTLHMETKTSVLDHESRLVRQRFCA